MDEVVLQKIGDVLALVEGQDFKTRAKTLLGEERVERDFVSSHSNGVAYFSEKLARFVEMDPERVEEIRFAAILHDIGKLAIPDEIIKKPGGLDRDEMAVMRQHAEAGSVLLGSDAPQVVFEVAKYHHERYDGLGYFGMKGEDIPFEARIVQIADIHDALTKPRQYKSGMPEGEALMLMTKDNKGGFGRQASDPFLLRRFVMMRLGDPVLHASLKKDEKDALSAYMNSDPMSDLELTDGLAEGWSISPTGARTMKYRDEVTGNVKVAEIRNAGDELIVGPFGPRAENARYRQPEPENDQQYSTSFRY